MSSSAPDRDHRTATEEITTDKEAAENGEASFERLDTTEADQSGQPDPQVLVITKQGEIQMVFSGFDDANHCCGRMDKTHSRTVPVSKAPPPDRPAVAWSSAALTKRRRHRG